MATFEQIGDWESYIHILIYKGAAQRAKRKLREAQATFERALFIGMTNLDPTHELFSDLYSNLGILCLWQANYPESIIWFSKQIKYLGDERSVSMAGTEINIGLVNYYLSRYEESRIHCEIGIKILKELGQNNHPFLSNAYTNIGLCHASEEEYDLALQYFEEALHILEASSPPRPSWIANVLGNISNMYFYKDDIAKALVFLEKSAELHESVWGKEHTWIANCIHNRGNLFFEKNDMKSAVMYGRQALEMRKKLLPIHHQDITKTYRFLGRCYLYMGKLEQALATFQEGISHREQVDPQDTELIEIYESMASIYAQQEKWEQAFLHMDKCIYILKPQEDAKSIKNYPKLIKSYGDKAELLLDYAASLPPSQKMDAWQQALENYQQACEHSAHSQRLRHDHHAKNKVAQSGQKYGKKGLKLAFQLYQEEPTDQHLQSIYWFMENNRASLLHEAVQQNQAQILAGIPDSLRKTEKNLSLDFIFYDQQLLHEQSLGNEADTARLASLKAKTFVLRQQRDSLRELLNLRYPAFQYLNFENTPPNMADRQVKLSKDELLLNFAFVDSSFLLFACNATQAQVYEIPWDSTDHKQLLRCIAFFQDEEKSQNEGLSKSYVQSYQDLSLPLYQQLLQPALEDFPSQTALQIIPDQALGYLPFEALLIEKINDNSLIYKNLPYLLRRYHVRYDYAISLPETNHEPNKDLGNLLAFAPQYSDAALTASREVIQQVAGKEELEFGQLVASHDEAASISKLWHGQSWVGAEASKANFLKHAGDYRMLHLAMHAFTNDSLPLQSGLVFAADEDRFLRTYEIYNLPLQADLTVLSACHTGFGKYQQGEGIMSLARAFRYAGCPNIVMSLWQADDVGTAQLMNYFYQNLKEGLGKAEALRQAKLSYIEASDKPMPNFWAGFVLIGDNEKISSPATSYQNVLFWGGMIILLTLFLLIVVYRKIRPKDAKTPLPSVAPGDA